MKQKVIDWFLMAACTLAVLEFVVFPALDSESFLMNVVGLTAFFVIVVALVLNKNPFSSNEEKP
jgi:hypothetical protein